MGALEGKVAIVTGGASGMGAGTVRRFIEEGAAVVIADVLAERGEALAAEIGERASFARCDVTSEDDVARTIDETVERHGRLDCMFNNAGSGGSQTPIDEITFEEWRQFHSLLLDGVFFGMKHAARVMKRQKFGSIISTSSVAGVSACYGPHPYSSAKAAVIQLTKAVAMELASHSVRANCIAPGAIVTSIFARSAGLSPEEADRLEGPMTEALQRAQPIPRAGLPADIAGAALWLASDDSSFVTGQTIVVDGGLLTGQPWERLLETWDGLQMLMSAAPKTSPKIS